MRGRFGIIVAAALFAAPSAHAAPVHDARSVAEAQALAEAALNVDDARAGWENVTTTTTPELRHRQSGAVCRFWADFVWAGVQDNSFGRAIEVGSEASCLTYVEPVRDGRWSIRVVIEAATQGLDGARYREWDGEFTPAIVTPAYRGRRSSYWEFGRASPVQHEPALLIEGPDGREVSIYRVHATIGHRTQSIMTALVNGWLVSLELEFPKEEAEAADAMTRDQFTHLLRTVTRPHPQAQRIHAEVDALLAAAAAAPESNATIDRLYDAFMAACVRPALAGRPFDEGIARQTDWTPASTTQGMPNILNDPAQAVWRVPGEGGDVFVQRSAAMAGDCAVSAYGVDAAQAQRVLSHRLTHGDDAPFGLGFNRPLDPGIAQQQFDGARWPGGGSLITNSNPDAGRPAVFLGIGPRPRD